MAEQTAIRPRAATALMAQTVLGPVSSMDLGITLPHEHLIIDLSVWFVEPETEEARKRAREEVNIQNLGWITYNQYNNLDNVRLLDEARAIREVTLFKARGGGTVVDCTSIGLGRDPEALARIAEATGLHIVAGSGYYVLRGPDTALLDSRSEEEVADEIISDLLYGIGDTGIRAGIIGEIGCSWPLLERERKCLRAAVLAQRATGAAITIHPGRGEDSPMEILRVLEAAGADLSRVVMGHLDRTGFRRETRHELARTGCSLEYDLFGSNPFYPLHFGVFHRPCDRERIEQILDLAEAGFLRQIFISQDVCLKSRLVQCGGTGYAHILENILPEMRARGLGQQEINTIMIANPARMLGFLKPSLS